MAEPTPVEPVTPVAPAAQPVAPPATQPVATPLAAPTQYTELISPKTNKVFRVPSDKVKAYQDYGYTNVKARTISEPEVHSAFDGWREGGQQFLLSTIGNAPFVRSAYAKTHSAEDSRWLAGQLDAYHKEHPILDVAASVVGTGAELAGATALAAAALPVAAAGAVGTALGGAGATIAATMTGGAISNAALGATARFDDAALHHAFEPAGQEKISYSLLSDAPNILQDAVLGAAGAGVIGGIGKLLTKGAGMMGSSAQKTLRAAVLKDAGVIQAQKQGRGGELVQAVDDVLNTAPGNIAGHIHAQKLKYGVQMETIKTTIGHRTALPDQERKALIHDLYSIAGSDDQIMHRLQKFIHKSAPGPQNQVNLHEWTLDHIQKASEKVAESIGWKDYDVNRAINDKYQDVLAVLKQAGQKLIQDNDPSYGGVLASSWNDSLKNYSKFALLGGAVKNAGKNTSVRDVLQNVATNAAGGAFLGTMLSGPVAGVGGAAAGLGYGVLKSVKPIHYAQAMKNLEGVFTSAGQKMTKAAMSGLYGVPAQLHSRHYADTDKLNATLAAVSADPAKAHANIRTHYANAGVPDVQADDAANRQFAALAEIASQMPQRQGGADMPTRTTPDKMQQRKINGMYKTLVDPGHAIANPTKENLAFAKKHYPEMVFAAQQAIIQQLQANPDLPYAVKAHAARVLGRPVSNSTTPKFSQLIQQARQQIQQAEQQGAQPGSGAQKSVSSGDSSGSGTRLDELQGGGG